MKDILRQKRVETRELQGDFSFRDWGVGGPIRWIPE